LRPANLIDNRLGQPYRWRAQPFGWIEASLVGNALAAVIATERAIRILSADDVAGIFAV